MDEMKLEQSESGGIAARRSSADGYPLLPAEAPLDMPAQPLAVAKRVRDRISVARALLLLMTTASTGTFAYVLYQVLSVVRLSQLQAVFLVLCTLCFAWVALGTSSAVVGFFAVLRQGRARADAQPVASQRTALLFPVYHEDAARVAATIEAIADELAVLGVDAYFDFFVLSDSRLAHIKSREERAVRLLRRRIKGRAPIYYRARLENIGQKAGNIADWVRRYGAAYESFIILDADSLMSGALLKELAGRIAASPATALIQTVPRLIGARTLFAHLQQFAVAFYGPVVAAGFAAWHQESGNYWGHNAIIRTRAFAAAAGLPRLPGSPPMGGHIQSHDFVEAAYLRRAGWEVWMLPGLAGSFEGCPPTLIDLAVRDRRWAQGNLQHLRILARSGLPWVSRLHLAMGAYAYFASVFWALSLLVGLALSIQSAHTLPVYFPDQKTLFPIWPVIDHIKALYLFLGTALVVLLPKVLGVVLAVVRSPTTRGRIGRFLMGAALETVGSMLLAPILMLTQTRAVLDVARGKDSGWSVQGREHQRRTLRELVRFHKAHVLIGVLTTLACSLASIYVLAWMAPVILGLLASIQLSALSGRTPPAWLERALATPESLRPPPIVVAMEARHRDWCKDPHGAGAPERAAIAAMG